MGLFKYVLGVGAIAAAAVAFAGAPSGSTPEASSKLERLDHFMVLDAGQPTGCEMTRKATGDGNGIPLVLGLACGANEAVGRVRYWRDRPDGTVELTDEAGSVALQLMAGDGADFESYGSGAPLVTLVAAQP